jgi:hypothetical protein
MNGKVFNGGVSLGKGLGKLTILLNDKMHETVLGIFNETSIDLKIISSAFFLKERGGTKCCDCIKRRKFKIKSPFFGNSCRRLSK